MSVSAIERASQLKALHAQLATKRGQLPAAKEAQRNAQRDLANLERDIKNLEQRIVELDKAGASAETIVSDHAVVRWLERVYGMNIEQVKEDILSEGVAAKVRFVGNGKIEKRGHTLVVKNNTIITVAPQHPGAITL